MVDKDQIERVRLVVNADQWRRLRIRALQEKKSLRQLMSEILEEYLSRG